MTTFNKNNNNIYFGICYGILFYFLIASLYGIIYRMIEAVFFLFELNLLIIPIILFALIVVFAFIFYKSERFPKLKVIYFIFIICVKVIEPYMYHSIITRYIAKSTSTDYKYSNYLIYISLCDVLLTLLFLSISWYKYKKIQKQQIDENRNLY